MEIVTILIVIAAVILDAVRHILFRTYQSAKHIPFLLISRFLQIAKANSRPSNILPTTSSNPSASTPGKTKYPRLSLSPSKLKTEYDVVIIGSGYGAGVSASRMARAGRSVCLLERGLEKWPGEYPHTFRDAAREYRVSGLNLFSRSVEIGKKEALYQTVKGQGQDVILGCGLGGTSLINAGVFLRVEERVLGVQEWPVEIREAGIKGMEKYYRRAEQMLQPSPFTSSYETPTKFAVFKKQASYLGIKTRFYRPSLTTFFHDVRNWAGVRMRGSTGTGNECSGINDGSKNSVLVTYLADAWARGAELFCGVDVTHVRKKGKGEKGYIVTCEITGENGEKTGKWISARDLVILGAGALGTTEILLRSQPHGLATSPLVGQRLSGNGDMLAFAYNCNQELDSMGLETDPRTTSSSPRPPCGPTITGCVDMRGSEYASSVREGFIIQDGTIPEALAPAIQALLETRKVLFRPSSYQKMHGLVARVKSWVLGAYARGGSVRRTLVFLVMSHDENHGTMTLKNNKAVVRWSGIGRREGSEKINSMLKKVTERLGGMFIKSPNVTAHPLGGAVMSNDGTGLGGVVNHRGQLFTGPGGEVHEGIFCLDGSIIPTSLGVNPCATITALAERACDLIIQERHWVVDESPNDMLDLFGKPPFSLATEARKKPAPILAKDGTEGVRFKETMQGHIHIGNDISDFATAEKIAKAAFCSAQLTIRVEARRAEDGSYLGFPRGTFACGALSHDPLLITRGTVKFFTIDEDVSDATNLIYDLDLLSTDGTIYAFRGYKRLDSAAAVSVSRIWSATTTLFATITGSNGSLIGRGILHLPLRNLISTLLSLRSHSDSYAQARFLNFFVKNIAAYALSPFRPLQYPTSPADTTGYFKKPVSAVVNITADDGMQVPIKIWHPPADTQEKHMPIVFIPGAAVDDQIFSLPTIVTNAIDYFTSLGYRCYVPIVRFGMGEAARRGDTVYDSRLDVKAAMKYVREKEDEREIYVIAHCLGSIAMGIALLTGDVDARWIKGMTCSQVFTNLILSKDNALKARSDLLLNAYKMLARSPWFSCHSTPSSPWFQYLLDQALRFYPVGTRRELCNSSVCHRCDVPFGRCWTHSNLNYATHVHLGHFFSGTHTNFVAHLSKMGAMPPNHHVRSNQPHFADLVTPRNLQKLEGLRINFLSGGENAVWKPQSTKESYDMLRDAFPQGQYERVVVEGYGHLDCWMGKRAYEDVFPRVRHHVELCEAFTETSHGTEDVFSLKETRLNEKDSVGVVVEEDQEMVRITR